MSQEQMAQLERLVNSKILQGLNMYPTLYPGASDPGLQQVKSCRVSPVVVFLSHTRRDCILEVRLRVLTSGVILTEGSLNS